MKSLRLLFQLILGSNILDLYHTRFHIFYVKCIIYFTIHFGVLSSLIVSVLCRLYTYSSDNNFF